MAERKGFRAMILATVQEKKSCTIRDILDAINDPDLKEQYVKNILYRAKKEDLVTKDKNVYSWAGEIDEGLQQRAEKKVNEARNRKEPTFEDTTGKLMYLCEECYTPAPDIIAEQPLHILEEFHQEQLSSISEEARKHPLYLQVLTIRCARKLELMMREHLEAFISPRLEERNRQWLDRDLIVVLEDPPATASGLPLVATASTGAIDTSGTDFKRSRKGFRGMILDCIAKQPTTIQGIVKTIGDPALKESYVKNIVYRMKKAGNVDEQGGKLIWTGPNR